METKYGFIKLTLTQFINWITQQRVARTIIKVQQHHTYIPNYSNFNGNNHFELQRTMQHHHKVVNGWMDIGQHFTIFPDGMVLTGRSLEFSPACIYGQNSGSICIENLGNFDIGGDSMFQIQKDTIVAVTAALCKKFNLGMDSNYILYHHWFRLDNGHRNNGAGGNKSCPGTAFFGGNKVQDFEANFLPLMQAAFNGQPHSSEEEILKYVGVTASWLNVRKGPSSSAVKVSDRGAAQNGSVLRVYKEQNGWLKISKSADHWVYGRYTEELRKYKVTATTLNVRSGPGIQHHKVGQVIKDDLVFIKEKENGWANLYATNSWVSMVFLEAVL